MKLHRTFDNLHVNRKNILCEYSSSFKPSLLNYLHLDWINLYRNDFVSKRLVTQAQNGDEKYRPLILPLILDDVRSQRNQGIFFVVFKSTCHARLRDWKVIIRIKAVRNQPRPQGFSLKKWVRGCVRNISVLSAHQWTKKKENSERKEIDK